MNRATVVGTFSLFLAVAITHSAIGQECDAFCDSAPAACWDDSGDLCCRSRLTGDWLGYRSRLESNGIRFEGNVTQYYQGTATGGLRNRFEYGGHNDYLFNLDMGKIIGAEGLFIKLRGESQFGRFINGDTGAILAANTSGLTPTQNEQKTALTNITATQMFSRSVGVFAGKIDTLDGDLNAYAHGRGKEQFMNTALVATPIAFRTTPYSTWGVGLVVLGAEGTPVFSLIALDPRDFATTFNLDDVFADGVTVNAELRLPTRFFHQPGHQLLGGIWSNRDVALLSTAPLLLLPSSPPLPTASDSWALYWNFDQQLVANRCDRSKGWGIFGRAAIADEETNPLEWFLSAGVGGTSPIRGRQSDTFGIGWYYAATSNQLPGLLLDDYGQGVEAFYNYQLTPWIHVTPDLQVIDPSRRGVDTSLLLGLRIKMTL